MRDLTRILMVEDEPDIQEVAKIALESVGGFTVEICSSGTEALAKLASTCFPDLILMDVMMPEVDGPTTPRKLRANPETAGYPVIFMTAKVQAHEVARYKELGALGVIAKPFDPMTLADTIRSLWELEHVHTR